ncbi:fibroblast growth factor-binding protein 3 [Otolemur garnettii]|uniref:Fibroblast growth factor binding protein 3 n=1 Tax=Otolemur garnettii TaxID=30611 RepID=H0XNI3_OTOGA|nr:fibroblast growth factor-binding protein 3 [Otolemur garnettii]
MSSLWLRASLSLLLLLGGCFLAAGRRDQGAAGSAVEPVPPGPRGGSSGRFISPEQHACSWQLLLPTPGAAEGSELALRCQGPDGARHQCAYRGEPERCATYTARRSHYWKQVLGALRKKRRPCHDPSPLQARLCAGKKGHGAELRLVSGASQPAHPTPAGFPGEPKPRARSRGRSREHAAGLAPSVRPKEKKTKGDKRKAASDPHEERPMGTGPYADALDENTELTKTYCAEKWHSLCNFFVNFWNG